MYSGLGTRVYYQIAGDFTLSKKPVLQVYRMDGRLIEEIPLKKQSGFVNLTNERQGLTPSGVLVCRLVYGKYARATKSVVLR
jgi:hypothetical protein